MKFPKKSEKISCNYIKHLLEYTRYVLERRLVSRIILNDDDDDK